MGVMPMYRQIAEQLYKLLVVNSYAAAIQQEDGRYVTKYFPLSPMVIEEMLKQHGSMGCYQQGYKNNRIKWLCFDFDCPDKNNPEIYKLYSEIVMPFKKMLDELNISYISEFSGRRGIHLWIIFNEIFPKETGFQIVLELRKRAKKILDKANIHIDYYPSTDVSKGNVVGKQVKFPLSCHRSGTRSFLFSDEFTLLLDCDSDEFLYSQLQILEGYSPNDLNDVENVLGINNSDTILWMYKYKKYSVVGRIDISLNKIEEILGETKVYREIFNRMKKGQARQEDWSVLLGTLVYCDEECKIVQDLFSTFPNYNIEKTIKNIEKLSDKYFPATFHYLYRLYAIEPEENIDLNETGFSYLLRRLGCQDAVLEKLVELNEHKSIQEIQYTLTKEKNYFLENDEVTDVLIWNRLNSMKLYDLKKLEDKATQIRIGNWKKFVVPDGAIIYNRIESEEKSRKMVSLSAEDRILTTHMTLILQSKLQNIWHSYSYNISLCSKDQIFYGWYSSWTNYITKVQTFLLVPFLNSYHVFVMDLKGFYDHIDFLAVYKVFEQELKDESKYIMEFLIAYNERIMKMVNGNSRCGVPQGPAYARVIAEAFLDYIIQLVLEQFDRDKFHFYRYVDDMVVYYKPEFDGEVLYRTLESTLLSFGLPLNQEKSGILGCVKYLTEREKKLISHKDKFSYDLRVDEDNVIFEEEQKERIRKYVQNHDFDITILSYIFGKRVLPNTANEYYKKYSQKIFSEYCGRGSYFRKFYQYLFSENGRLIEALEKQYLMLIPINSLNFSNFVHSLYLAIQDNCIDLRLVREIQNKYLKKIKDKVKNKRDLSVIEAILLI